jgi:hypothetical protein
LLGAQIVGSRKAEISKRIDTVAVALSHHAAVEELNDMDLRYTPPLAAVGIRSKAAQNWAVAAGDATHCLPRINRPPNDR